MTSINSDYYQGFTVKLSVIVKEEVL